MNLGHLYAHNFRGFSEVNLNLGKSAVFFGVNGVGKSSLLALINYLLRPWCNRLNPSQQIEYYIFNSNSDTARFAGMPSL